MELTIGEIYFVSLFPDNSNEIMHPHVIIEIEKNKQGEQIQYKICMISTNMKKAYWPGNILLEKNEGGLEKQSIAICSKTALVNDNQFMKYIGKLGEDRVNEIKISIKQIGELIKSRKE